MTASRRSGRRRGAHDTGKDSNMDSHDNESNKSNSDRLIDGGINRERERITSCNEARKSETAVLGRVC